MFRLKEIQFKCMNEAETHVFVFIIIEVCFFLLGILEAVGKILWPNSYMNKVCVFLVIAPAFQLAIFSEILI